MKNNISFLHYYPQINDYATEFLTAHNPDNVFPLEIEDIIELKLKIKILTIPTLLKTFNIDGFISSSLKTITLDDEQYQNPKYNNRLRFTLAHEIGHYVLHKGILEKANYETTEEYNNFRNSFSEKDIGSYEFQAHSFAGLILIPQKMLISDLKNFLGNLAVEEPVTRMEYLSYHLSSVYLVSPQAVRTRIGYEKRYNKNLQDELGPKLYNLLIE